MRKHLLLVLFVVLVALISGCALLNRVAPSQLDAAGNPIPGTHQANPAIQGIADMIPNGIGSVAIGVLLLAWNGYEKYQAYKSGKGLKSTLLALKQVRDDPALKQDWEGIKTILSDAHKVAGVQTLINKELAKI